jgi:hypothetical protein
LSSGSDDIVVSWDEIKSSLLPKALTADSPVRAKKLTVKHGPYRSLQTLAIEAMLKNGEAGNIIARYFGVSRQRVHQIKNRMTDEEKKEHRVVPLRGVET